MVRSKLFTEFNPVDMFDEWFLETYHEDNFENNIGFFDHIEEEFDREFKEQWYRENGLEEKEDAEDPAELDLDLAKAKKEKIKDYAYDWFMERLADFTEDLDRKTETHELGILCRRALTVDDEAEFIFHLLHGVPVGDFKGLGVCWSWDKQKASPHWSQGSILMKVDAVIPWKAISQKETFFLNMNPSLGFEEAEIRTHDQVELLVLSVNDEEFPEPITVLA